jgi:hypothetical protein
VLVDINQEIYEDYVVYEGKNIVLYIRMLKALYGMIQSALLFYKKFRKDLEGIGFKINDYDPCVANRIIDGEHYKVISTPICHSCIHILMVTLILRGKPFVFFSPF